MIKNIIRKIIPHSIKVMHGKYRLYWLQRGIIKYLRNTSEFEKFEETEIINYLRNNLLSVFPYNFTKKYNAADIIVYTDSNNMKYVLHENKKLYFKKKWDENKIKSCYNRLLIEQDIDSPHRYQTADFCVNEGNIVVDAGAAEGNFALSIVEKVTKLYLFEVDEEWVEALKVTFEPWKEKVEIICKYVSNNDEGNCITLDAVFWEKKIDFIKADIEGAEIALLKGCKNILSDTEKLKVVMCTYHKQDDAENIDQLLTKAKFNTEFSKGYMLFLYDTLLAPPYLRRGLIRAIK